MGREPLHFLPQLLPAKRVWLTIEGLPDGVHSYSKASSIGHAGVCSSEVPKEGDLSVIAIIIPASLAADSGQMAYGTAVCCIGDEMASPRTLAPENVLLSACFSI